MTWQDIKKYIEDQGVTNSTVIEYIDFDCPDTRSPTVIWFLEPDLAAIE